MRSLCAKLAIAAAAFFNAHPVAAHGLGERYDLPLPLGLYLSGAVATVALSFLALAAFANTGPALPLAGSKSLGNYWKFPSVFGGAALSLAVRALSVGLFVLLLAAGLFGSPDPFKNPLPVSIWVLGWVGLAYVNALIGNIWAVINPWDNVFRLCEWIARRRLVGRNPTPVMMPYPAFLEAWPAVILFMVFAWLELIWPARDRPASLSAVILAYSGVTWTGIALFGRRTWLERGEFLTVAFGLLSRFAIVGSLGDQPDGSLRLRPPAVGLRLSKPVPPSIAAFALLMLSTVTFDGLLETPLWIGASDQALALSGLQVAANLAGVTPDLMLVTAALLIFPLMFSALYLLTAWLIVGLAGDPTAKTSEIARLFVLTLVPIAIGYHLSHYLSYLLIAGQFIIPIASDPFALGWNLLGTSLYVIDFNVINSRFVWYASWVLIVGGHVVAVWLAHVQAQQRFTDRRAMLRSQIPMVGLMVGYTALSLWILAQPIVSY